MKKRIKIFLSILIVFIISITSQAILNKEYLSDTVNKRPTSSTFNLDSMKLVNWDSLGEDTFVSKEDGQIILDFDTVQEVKKIKIMGNIQNEAPLSPKVYYTIEQNQEFSEELAVFPEVVERKNRLALSLNLSGVKTLRIDLNETPGLVMTTSQVNVSHSILQIWWLALLLSITLSTLGVIFLNIPLSSYKALPAQWENFKKYNFLLQNLIKRDITTKYRRSTLGILWSVLNPLLMMMVITAVFQHLFRSNIEHFPIYYLTGSLIFNFIVEATNASMNSMLEAAPLIKKVYIPKYIFPMEKTLFSLVNMMFSLIAVIIIYIALKFPPPITALLFPIPIFYAFTFCLGFGMILATMNVFFRDISHLYGVWTTAWLYLTPIMYPIDILPTPVLTIVRLNPLHYYIEYFRNIMMYGIVPTVRDNLICLFFSISFLLVGFLVFKRNQDKFILHI